VGLQTFKRSLTAQASGATDVGRAREHNEDAFLVARGGRLAAVADGMGGHNAGEVAARIALDSIKTRLDGVELGRRAERRALLGAAIKAANTRVHTAAAGDAKLRGMGSTLVVALFEGRVVQVAHAGDSRVYRLRDKELARLTRDHSLRAEVEAIRPLSPEELASLPANVLTRAVGLAPKLEADHSEFEMRPRDRYLLCSDGLHGLVNDDGLKAILMTHPDRELAVAALIAAANAAGGKDNITAIVVDVALSLSANAES
jgi:protein phosphatase